MGVLRKISRACSKDAATPDNGLETAIERKQRWRSIYVVYFLMFLMTLGFSIVITGVWPYLDKLDPNAGKEFMGFIVAANPFAEMIFSPIMGWWSNRLGSIRLPLLLSVVLFSSASAMYSSLEIFPTNRKYWMLTSRFLVGVGSSSIAIGRSYLSAATTVDERTTAISMASLAQVLGFIVGPALQALVTPLGDEGVPLIPGILSLNMYTAAGWINVGLGLLNFTLFLPWFFVERRIAAKEAMLKQGATSEEDTWKATKPDYLCAWTLIMAYFILVFNFVLLETLGTVITMDNFAWTKEEALYYMGILMSVGGVIACVSFAAIGPLGKIVAEHKILLWGGFFLMVVGRGLHFPWGSAPPLIADANNTANGTEVVGCPPIQEWCTYVNALTLSQFILGFCVTSVGYPMAVALSQTIFSKVLGPRPQGVWMGLLTGAGCFSRVLGPVFVSVIYTRYGTNWTVGLTLSMMLVPMAMLALMDKRLRRTPQSAEDEGSCHEEMESLRRKEEMGSDKAGESGDKMICDDDKGIELEQGEMLREETMESEKLHTKDEVRIVSSSKL